MKISSLAGVCLLFICMSVWAAEPAVPPMLKQKMAEKYPDIDISSIIPSVLPGLYEVATPSEIVYVDGKGEHLVIGQIIEVKSGKNMTEARWNEINKIDFNALPFDKAIKFVKGKGSRKLAIFEDPFCPYCEELEKSLQSLDDLTIYVFLLPLESIHPGATDAANEIWCADDRAAAWSNWMLNRKAPEPSTCDTPVESILALGKQLKLNSTPTMFLADGSRIPGSIDADKLELRLRAVK